ncbi:hypothetical protein G3M53_39085 [Streptomyces sp. SID7982]|nr:hypothetical protein [Streptomyces sp. SID7982]
MAALRRGTGVRSLHQQTIRSHASTLEHSRDIIESGGQVRTLHELTDWLMVCDARVAFLPMAGDGAPAAVAIRDPATVRYLTSAFDVAWGRAAPLAEDRIDQDRPLFTSDLQRTIIRLVVNGHTDSVIADRVGTSTRTVAEHVRRVSAQLGSRSRAELGYLVARTNLLAEQEAGEGKVPAHG